MISLQGQHLIKTQHVIRILLCTIFLFVCLFYTVYDVHAGNSASVSVGHQPLAVGWSVYGGFGDDPNCDASSNSTNVEYDIKNKWNNDAGGTLFGMVDLPAPIVPNTFSFTCTHASGVSDTATLVVDGCVAGLVWSGSACVLAASLPNLIAVNTAPAASATFNNPASIAFTGTVSNSNQPTTGGTNFWADVEIDWNNPGCVAPVANATTTAGGPWNNVGVPWGPTVISGTLTAVASQLQNGTHCYRMIVDRANFIAEGNELDNGATWRQFTVSNLPQCSDGVDNEGDTHIDYPADPDCSSDSDTSESNGIDLTPGVVTIMGTLTIGSTITLNSTVSNSGTLPTSGPFTDNFTYQWGGTGGAWNPFTGNSVVQGVLASGATSPDSVSFTIPGSGNLYIQHCVDSGLGVAESIETNNCAIGGPYIVAPGTTQCSDGIDNGDPEDSLADFGSDPDCTSASDNSEESSGLSCVATYGNSCPSAANSCGMTNLGTIQCDGTCGTDETILKPGSGTYTVPNGATSLAVQLWGAGGGGGGGEPDQDDGCGCSGGGGGGGGYVKRTITSPLLVNYPYSVGIGGAGGAIGYAYGGNGGQTTFSSFIAGGGATGVSGADTGAGGAGGAGDISGGNGANGSRGSDVPGGVGGAGAEGGAGGAGGPANHSSGASAGIIPGGGGGGGYGAWQSSSGANGADGRILIYIPVVAPSNSVCAAVPTLTTPLTATDCTILVGAGTCTTNVAWTITNPVSPSVTVGGVEISTSPSSGETSWPISHGPKTVIVSDGGNALDSTTAKATCAPGGVWDATQSKCVAPTITLTGTPRVVKQGTNVTLTWNTGSINETTCSLTGGTISGNPLTGGGGGDEFNGTTPVLVNANTTYTLTCGILRATTRVEIIPKGFET